MAQEHRSPSVEELWAVIQDQRALIQEMRTERRRRGLRGSGRMLTLAGFVCIIAVSACATAAFASMSRSVTSPDANGVIHGCYSVQTGSLRVAGGSCRKGEKSLAWYHRVSRAFCRQCNYQFANLSNKDLRGGYYAGTKFGSANLSHAILYGGNFRIADFGLGQRKVNGQTQTGPPTVLDGASVVDADLQGANLAQARASNTLFVAANLVDANLHSADAPSANFSYASLPRAILEGANLFNTNFWFANLTGVDARRTYFRQADMRWSNLEGARLAGAYLIDANLTGARGKPADQYFPDSPPVPYSSGATFSNTTCPDGTNTNSNGGSCDGHWLP